MCYKIFPSVGCKTILNVRHFRISTIITGCGGSSSKIGGNTFCTAVSRCGLRIQSSKYVSCLENSGFLVTITNIKHILIFSGNRNKFLQKSRCLFSRFIEAKHCRFKLVDFSVSKNPFKYRIVV